MENLGEKLKEIRKSRKMTRKEVAERLREKGFDISDKTLYGYENGRTTANADLFMALCEIYGIKDVLTMFGYDGYREDGSIILSHSEIELIENYRGLDEEVKERIKETVDRELQFKRLSAYAELVRNKEKIHEREHNKETG